MDWPQYDPDENTHHGDYGPKPFTPEYKRLVLQQMEEQQAAREAELAEMRAVPLQTICNDPCRYPGCREGDVSDPVTGAVLACPECGGSTSRAWVSHHDAIAAQIISNWETAE